MVRQTDRPATRKERNGAGRRGGNKADKTQTVLCGWNLPVQPDDNDIMTWMSREENGDNDRKNVTEVYEEEQYRHISGHCRSIEDTVFFDRHSLHQRYLHSCQFGVEQARDSKDTPISSALSTRSACGARRAVQQDLQRNCFSANLTADDDDSSEDDEKWEESVMGVGGGRNPSGACRKDSFDACDAGARPDSLYTPQDETRDEEDDDEQEDPDDVRDEEDDCVWDEGYGSKVSSNDQEQDGGEEDNMVVGQKGTCQYDRSRRQRALGEYGHIPLRKVRSDLNSSHLRYESTAKLIFSRPEPIICEGLSPGRMMGQTRRQHSHLTEAGFRHVTPTYLARYYKVADTNSLPGSRQVHNSKQKTTCPAQDKPHKSRNGADSSAEKATQDEAEEDGQPKTLVLHKITIQDSGKELFSQHIHSPLRNRLTPTTSQALTQPFDRVHRQKANFERKVLLAKAGLCKTPRTSLSELGSAFASESSKSAFSELCRSSVSDMAGTGVPRVPQADGSDKLKSAGVDKVSLKIQDLTSDLLPQGSQVTSSPASVSATPLISQTKPQPSPLCLASLTEDEPGSSVQSPSTTSPSQDKLANISTFPMLDLLPAVENNIRIHRTAQRWLSKAKVIDVTSSLNTIKLRRQQSQQQQLQLQSIKTIQKVDGEAETGDSDGVKDVQQTSVSVDGPAFSTVTNVVGSENFIGSEEIRSFPAFRPNYYSSPLQRAKEIVDRRLHGHVTHILDGGGRAQSPTSQQFVTADQQHAPSPVGANSAARWFGEMVAGQSILKGTVVNMTSGHFRGCYR